jgi:2-keto-4-pentenoate hydratase/2-oxohepta-3-ene-1,7-dioic acid hydratase in catechol pathway
VTSSSPSDPLRLLSFAPAAGDAIRVGALSKESRVVDLGSAAERLKMKLSFDPTQMLSLIAAGETALTEVRRLLEKASSDGPLVEKVRLFAPIPKPPHNIYAVGFNYVEHFEESAGLRDPNQALPEHPVFFTKSVNSVNGPYDPVPCDPTLTREIDWECELAVIMGKRGKDISEGAAHDYIFGFCVLNDVTARDLQHKTHGGQWFKGKSLDGYAPMGPWIVTAGGFAYDDLRLVTRVNGVVKQDGTTRQMYFKVPRIISELSRGLTLEPGDIIATGTPSGIGFARKPQEFLKAGDVVETEIVGIGALRNTLQAA